MSIRKWRRWNGGRHRLHRTGRIRIVMELAVPGYPSGTATKVDPGAVNDSDSRIAQRGRQAPRALGRAVRVRVPLGAVAAAAAIVRGKRRSAAGSRAPRGALVVRSVEGACPPGGDRRSRDWRPRVGFVNECNAAPYWAASPRTMVGAGLVSREFGAAIFHAAPDGAAPGQSCGCGRVSRPQPRPIVTGSAASLQPRPAAHSSSEPSLMPSNRIVLR